MICNSSNRKLVERMRKDSQKGKLHLLWPSMQMLPVRDFHPQTSQDSQCQCLGRWPPARCEGQRGQSHGQGSAPELAARVQRMGALCSTQPQMRIHVPASHANNCLSDPNICSLLSSMVGFLTKHMAAEHENYISQIPLQLGVSM